MQGETAAKEGGEAASYGGGWYASGKSLSWNARYWLSRWAMTFGLWVMPRGRYRDELLDRIYALRDKVIVEVLVHRFKEQEAHEKSVAAGLDPGSVVARHDV